ncbi:hypothetical protein SDC9_82917 [bioreactor metagenome]|uniref:Uncharacterized protein n=1 Tax=bioreactor metagenome TaxID=1076179 RepID=A0A644Z682_9ZZZZ
MGLLKENILGDISPKPIPQSVHANLVLMRSSSCPMTSMRTIPLDISRAVSTESTSLFCIPSFTINLSITTSMLCFLFLSRLISSSNSMSSPSTLTLTYPSFLMFSRSFLWVPFAPLTIGAKICIFVLSSYSRTLSVIWSTV